jgi:hypothetical protein
MNIKLINLKKHKVGDIKMKCDCEKPDWVCICHISGLGGGSKDLYQCKKCKTIDIERPLDALFG